MNGYGNGRIRRADAYRNTAAPDDQYSRNQPYITRPVQEADEEELPDETEYDENESRSGGTNHRDHEPDMMESAQLIATNRTVCLTCTLAAFCSLFAAFLLWAERDSYAIRHNSKQSVALGVIHLVAAVIAFPCLIVLGSIPLIGIIVTLCCWLFYFAVLIFTLVSRLKLMRHAWLGYRYEIPLIGGHLDRQRNDD